MIPSKPEERGESPLVTVCKAAWFLTVTAGQAIAGRTIHVNDVEKVCDDVGKKLEKMLEKLLT